MDNLLSRSGRSLVSHFAGTALLALLVAGCSGSKTEPVTPSSTEAETAPTKPVIAESVKPPKTKAITEASFGNARGTDVKLFTLTNKNGLVAKITNYGAIVTELHTPDKNGKSDDIVLGFDNVDAYVKGNPYFGAIVGRVANRIKNSTFKLEGKAYKLNANNAPHHLHGGNLGFDKVVWTAEPLETDAGPALKLTYVSKDGEENYPGTLTAHATYTLTNDDELKVDLEATTDKTTLVNLAHHTYWNLGGQASGTILEEKLKLFADSYTPGDPVPDGKVKPVKGTPFDFTSEKVIGKDLKAVGGKPVGFDHNFVVNGDANALRPVARLEDPKTGRILELSADQPGVQFYTGNYLDGSVKGKGGAVYAQYDGLCLESQKFPNSINVPAWQNEVILKPGVTYKHSMVHKFSVAK